MTIYNQIESNKRRTWIIMAFFIVFITTIAYVFGKANGYGFSWAGVALIISGLMSFGSYYYADKLVLLMSNAKPVTESSHPQLYHIVQNLCIGAGLPLPKMYFIEDTAPNAFATGRDPSHAVICITSGLLMKLNKMELEGVIAHELSHIKDYDTRLMAVVIILVGVVTLLADWFTRSMWFGGRSRNERDSGSQIQVIFLVTGIILSILSPFFAMLIQLSISRKREYLADASAVLLTRYPEGLASALEKISHDKEPLEAANKATAHLYIIDPFKGKNIKSWFSGLFNTHPPVEERKKILRSM